MKSAFGMPLRRAYVRSCLTLTTLLACAAAPLPAPAQQKTGPGMTDDDSLTWHGITLYGVIDIGLQYDTHSAPFTPYRPSASGNIVALEQQWVGARSHTEQHGSDPGRPAGNRALELGVVGRISNRDLFQSAVRSDRRFAEIPGVEQRQSPRQPKRGCGWKLGRPGIPDGLRGLQIGRTSARSPLGVR